MQTWVIGNWKQNPATSHEAGALVQGLLAAIDAKSAPIACQLMVAPSSIHLAAVSTQIKGTLLLAAAQDISAHSDSIGAYTGDCSAQQVADAGATWILLGHSERRQYHQESHEALIQKLSCALKQNLGVIFCIGETQAQYDDDQTLDVIDEQLSLIKDLLEQQPEINDSLSKRLLIAYEPVWAIGTGKVPTVAEVSATHQHIKQTLAGFSAELANISVLYGGSVNADNAQDFATDSMIDGALVGGASLKVESFLAIADAFGQNSE